MNILPNDFWTIIISLFAHGQFQRYSLRDLGLLNSITFASCSTFASRHVSYVWLVAASPLCLLSPRPVAWPCATLCWVSSSVSSSLCIVAHLVSSLLILSLHHVFVSCRARFVQLIGALLCCISSLRPHLSCLVIASRTSSSHLVIASRLVIASFAVLVAFYFIATFSWLLCSSH